MRIVLDESVPRLLAKDLTDHDVATVPRLGWGGLTNGELLRKAAADGYQIFITADRNLRYQQNVAVSGIAVVVLLARSNKLEDYRPLVPEILNILTTIQPGMVVEIGRRPG